MALYQDPLATCECESHIFDVAFCPTKGKKQLAAAEVSGVVAIFDLESNECLKKTQRHNGSARSVGYFEDGRLVSVGQDKSALVTDAESGKKIHRFMDVSEEPLNKVLCLPAKVAKQVGYDLVVGDDAGAVHFLDTSSKKKLSSVHEQEDFISDMALFTAKPGSKITDCEFKVYCTAGDGTLGIYDLSKRKLYALSDPQDDELLSLAVVRGGKNIVVGAQEGDLRVFSQGDYGDCKDRILGHKQSVDAMVSLSRGWSYGGVGETTSSQDDPRFNEYMFTGCADGKIRLVSVHSKKHGNRVVGVLGQHSTEAEMPVDGLKGNPNERFQVASLSHDHIIRVWDFEKLIANALDQKDEGGTKKKKRKTRDLVSQSKQLGFFDDMASADFN